MTDNSEQAKDPFLIALGERLKTLRARRGLTRKALARMEIGRASCRERVYVLV